MLKATQPHFDYSKLFRPKSVAIVGASESRPRSKQVITSLLNCDVELFLVNPKNAIVFGLSTYQSLTAIGRPVDAIFASINASSVIHVVAEAAKLSVGGVVVNSGGFLENGDEGAELQSRLIDAAGAMPVLGPNCNGYIDVTRSLRLSGAPPLPIEAGGVSFVTHSGALIASMGAIGHQRQIGFSYLISTGNEANLDMADCINFLVDDPKTKVICLAVEAVRRPLAFLRAVDRAHSANKPIIALRLGRGKRAQSIATSHTGALAGESWVYDVAFKQHGIELAYDLIELVDRAICFDQLPASRWSSLSGLAVLTASGGGAGIISDISNGMGIDLPELEDLKHDVQTIVPGAEILNPLDMTGFVVGDAFRAKRLMEVYAKSPEIDSILVQWFVADEAADHGSAVLDALTDIAKTSRKTLMLGSLEDSEPGSKVTELRRLDVAVTHGLSSTLRSLQSMGNFVSYRSKMNSALPLPAWLPIAQPEAQHWVNSDVGSMLKFESAMHLLRNVGFEIAPFLVVARNQELDQLPFEGPYAVKLADVPHRTEIGAVRLNVSANNLAQAITELKAIADRAGLSQDVAIQKQLRFDGEAFIGIKGETQFGPIVVCGAGGILIELMKEFIGGVSPVSSVQIDGMIGELSKHSVFNGIRGSKPWDRAAFRSALESINRLATGSGNWLASLDINPLAVVGNRLVVLDALVIAKANNVQTPDNHIVHSEVGHG